MATVRFSSTLKNNVLTPVQAAIDAGTTGGTIKIYSGSMPTTVDTAITSQVLLGTLTFSKPCGTIDTGALTMSAITQDSAADATGTAAWARIADSNGEAAIDIDVSATGGSGALRLNTTNIVIGGPILITSFVISVS